MTIKTKFSHPQKSEKKSNMSWTKSFVFSVQAVFLFLQIWALAHFDFEKNTQLIPRLIMLIVSAIVFIGFLIEQKIIMTVHILFMASFLAWPIFLLQATILSLFKSLEGKAAFINTEGPSTGSMVETSVTLFLFSLLNLVYIACCYNLLVDIKHGHPEVLPYNSKVHGSSQASEKLIYPNI
ncbi:hypothetical protein B9Z55_010794 [Caenorhabditis nigoni]|uniref:Transmembrane protein n=2 Tax=Caenorhabditis nigoni TaxID=1611254 RepID=A0A2G5UHL6_9PELO|nr:hypothetical protein B9Z55_010794 [Caenorhabditis nigoni]